MSKIYIIGGCEYRVKQQITLKESLELENLVNSLNANNLNRVIKIIFEPVDENKQAMDLMEIKEADFYEALSEFIENKKKLSSLISTKFQM